MIPTIRGPLAPEELGITVGYGSSNVATQALEEELRRFAEAGGRSLIPTGSVLDGDVVSALTRMIEMTGTNLIPGVSPDAANPYQTKAGVLAASVTSGSAQAMASLRAVADATLATGMAVAVSAGADWQALRALDLLQAKGVDLRRVAIGIGGPTDVEDLCSIAVRGAWLFVDAAADGWIPTLCGLVGAGWPGQLLLALDSCGRLPEVMASARAAGITGEVLDEILVRNPRCYLTGDR